MQEEFKERGFLLLVKPSDSHKIKGLTQKEIGELIQKANKTVDGLEYAITRRDDLTIPLEKLLQVFLAFVKDGYFAFTKKHLVLKQRNDIFDSYTSKIHKFLTTTDMVRIYCLYKRAENEQKNSEDRRTPIPYYVIGFLGSLIGKRTEDDFRDIQVSLGTIFNDKKICDEAYKYLVALSKNYRRSYEQSNKGDYTLMIKRPIDEVIFHQAVGNANDFGQWESINKWAKS